MSETIFRLSNLSKTMDEAWETMDFSVYDKESKKIDFTLMELSRQLRSGLLDCVWFDNSYEKVIWTRSLKKKDAIQITSFSQKYKTPNGDEQASDYKELLEITKRSGIYNGIELHALTV